jgi:hypothetical protein
MRCMKDLTSATRKREGLPEFVLFTGRPQEQLDIPCCAQFQLMQLRLPIYRGLRVLTCTFVVFLAVMGEVGEEDSGAESRRCNAVLVRIRANAASDGGLIAEAFSAAAHTIATAWQNRPSHSSCDVSLLWKHCNLIW